MHIERHKNHRIGWLRAAVLGANDGIVSTASLILGVAEAGAISMAAGEYLSVCSQADTEQADLERERLELAGYPKHEHEEMTAIYVGRGLNEALAAEVARQLMSHDALGAHSRDELGITDTSAARPELAACS